MSGAPFLINITFDDCPSLDIFDPHSPFVAELSRYGVVLQIPELRQFIAEAVYFKRMDAAIPQCKPSRAAQMWGAYAGYTRCWSNTAGNWNDLLDQSLSLPAHLRANGFTTYGTGKLVHEHNPPENFRTAAFDEYGLIPEGAARTVTVDSVSGISGAAGQVITDIPITTYQGVGGMAGGTGANGAEIETEGFGGWVNVTLNEAGTGIAAVEVTCGPRAVEFDFGASGNGYQVGDVLIADLSEGETTGPAVSGTALLDVTGIVNYFQLPGRGPYDYGDWTGDPLGSGDTFIAEVIAPQVIAGAAASNKARALWFGLKAVHTPTVVQARFKHRHANASITIPAGWDPASSWVLRYISEFPAAPLVDADELTERLRYFAAAFEEASYNFGRIIQALKDAGVYDRAIIVLWSDHGYMHGDRAYGSGTFKGTLEKGLPYGTCARCLSAIRAPRLNDGICEEPVSAIDLYPTICDLLGLETPEHVQGQSLVPAMRDPSDWQNSRGVLLQTLGNLAFTIKADGPAGRQAYRLVRWFNGEVEFYCDEEDPTNRINLYADSDYADALAEVEAAFDAELARIGTNTEDGSDTGSTADEVFERYAAASVATALQGYRGDDTYIVGDEDITIAERADGGFDVVVFQQQTTEERTFRMPPDVEAFFSDATAAPPNVIASPTGGYIQGRLAEVYGGSGNDVIVQGYIHGDALWTEAGGGDDLVHGAGGADTVEGDGSGVLVDDAWSDLRLDTDDAGDMAVFLTPLAETFAVLTARQMEAADDPRQLANASGPAIDVALVETGSIGQNDWCEVRAGSGVNVSGTTFTNMSGGPLEGALTFVAVLDNDGKVEVAAIPAATDYDQVNLRLQVAEGASAPATLKTIYMQVAAGRHAIGGTEDLVEAGSVYMAVGSEREVRFAEAHPHVPVIIAQVQEQASIPLVVAQIKPGSVTRYGFTLVLAGDPSGEVFQGGETVAWAAFPPKAITDGGLTFAARTLGTAGNDTLRGFAGDDSLSGGAGDDLVEGGTGADTVDGGEGDDEVKGGAGNDLMTGGDGNDTMYGLADNDTMSGGDGDDYMEGGTGGDSMTGDAGDDEMDGMTGNDTLDGGAGADTLRGGEGNDSVVGGANDDSVRGGEGNDTLSGNNGNDTLVAGEGNDSLTGGADADLLLGEAGDDVIAGDAGNDTLQPGSGNDTMTGGTGADEFWFGADAGNVTITDFSSGDGDVIKVDGEAHGFGTLAAIVSAAVVDGSDYLITAPETGSTIRIVGINTGIATSWFAFL